MLVSQILKGKSGEGVITIAADASVGEAVALLSTRRIGAVVVSSDGVHAEGILSERDIVRELGREGPSCLERPIREVMTAKVVTCAPGEEAVAVLGKMTDGRFRHIPVVEDGRMIGLISIGDVVKARLDELKAEKDALVNMIAGR